MNALQDAERETEAVPLGLAADSGAAKLPFADRIIIVSLRPRDCVNEGFERPIEGLEVYSRKVIE